MSTVVSKRRLNSCESALKANSLIRYTLEVTSNEKYFKPCYKALTDDIIHTSEAIFTKIWEAFNIRIDSYQDAKWRYRLQTEAILLCKNLLALLNIGYSIYHLRGNRVEYWTGLILDTRQSIAKWRTSDYNKYSGYEDYNKS